MRIVGLCCTALLVGACKPPAASPSVTSPPAAAPQVAKVQAPPEFPSEPATKPEPSSRPGPIPWIENDFPKALADAKANKRPLVIDYWAHWCHTCINMQHTVLRDPSLASMTSRFTWASIDTEKPKHKELLARFSPLSWPTFYVIDPVNMQALASFSGGASLAQFRSLLEEGEQAFQAIHVGGGTFDEASPIGQLTLGRKAMDAKDMDAAAQHFEHALQRAPKGWPRRMDTQVMVLRSLQKRPQRCLEMAQRYLSDQGPEPSSAEFFYFAGQCSSATKQSSQNHSFRRKSLDRMTKILEQGGAQMSVDDQSTLLVQMREYALALGQPKKAREYATSQRELLDRAAKAAPNAFFASAYNWPREEVYVFLGQGEDLIADLKASEAALPDNYDPPHRLAWLYHKLGKLDLAQEAALRARALVQGPRRARIDELLASIEQSRQSGGR